MELTISNIISVFPLLFYISQLFIIISKSIRKLDVTINIKYFFGLVSSSYVAQALKYLTPYPKWSYKYTMRPEGARDCDYLSCGGLSKPNSPGMPSGHMTTTGYFVVYNILYIIKHNYNKSLIFANIILLIIMGWARINKKCHNLIQVICGSILGSLMGALFFKL
jgi:membrane-associated phospholipid phosphatase